MNIKTTEEYIQRQQISKNITIEFEIENKTIELEFVKSVRDDDSSGWDNDMDFEPSSQEIFDTLSEDQQDEINAYINDIKMPQCKWLKNMNENAFELLASYRRREYVKEQLKGRAYIKIKTIK